MKTFFVENNSLHEQFTTKECFEAMGCTDDIYLKSKQLEAGNICLEKNTQNVELVKEWLGWVQNKQAIYPFIKNHRYDQSILTNLVIKDKEKFKNYILPIHLIYKYININVI